MTIRSDAAHLIGWGLEVLPAAKQHPLMDDWQHPHSAEQCLQEWDAHPNVKQAAAIMARSNLLVLDLDSDAGIEAWRAALPKDLAMQAACALSGGPNPKKPRTQRGIHLWFRRPSDFPVQDFLRGDKGFDVRAFGVILVPPTRHRDGTVYEWKRPLPATPDLLPMFPSNLPEVKALLAPSKGTSAKPILKSKSGLPTLDALIASPPVEGTRDAVLISTLGRFANRAWPRYDYARSEVDRAAAALVDIPTADVVDRFERAWAYEDRKRTDVFAELGVRVDPERLVTTVEVAVGSKDERTYEDRTWLPWVITDAQSVRDPVENENQWYITANVKVGLETRTRRAVVPAWRFKSNRDLEHSLSAENLALLSPGVPARESKMDARHRLQAVLQSTYPTDWVKIPPGLWSAADLLRRFDYESPHPYLFVSEQTTLDPQGRVIPMHDEHGQPTIPLMSRSRRTNYDIKIDRTEALQGWRDLLTFHFPEAMAPLAALTCMLPLKPLLVGRAFFPFLAVTGQAGSGKSNSAVGRLVAASGMQGGTGRITAAGAKRMMGESRTGWLWIDDIEDPGNLAEVLRQVTDERTMTQAISGASRGMNEFPLLQIPLLTGETLGSLEGERALEERVVHVELPGMVKDRRSLIDPKRAQWDDIEVWDRRFDGGASLAGPLVSAALEAVGGHSDPAQWLYDHVKALGSLTDQSDRLALKEGVLQFGARLATYLARGMPAAEAKAWYTAGYLEPIHPEINLIEALAKGTEERIQHDEAGRIMRRSSNVMRVICEFLAGLDSYQQAFVLPKNAKDGTATEHLQNYPVKVMLDQDHRPVVYVYLPGLERWAVNQRTNQSAGHRVVSKSNWAKELTERGWRPPKNVTQRVGQRVWRATTADAIRICHDIDFVFPAEARLPVLPPRPEGDLYDPEESDEWG
jgi:hypothetical protein